MSWPLEELVAWVFGPEEDADPIEEHLLTCDGCAAVVTRLCALRDAVNGLVREGRIAHAATPALIARMGEDGLDLMRYELRPGEEVDCRATTTQRYALTHLHLERAPASRIDLEVAFADGTVLDRAEDLTVNAGDDSVIVMQPGDQVRMLPSTLLQLRLLTVDDEGERELAKYWLRHRALGD